MIICEMRSWKRKARNWPMQNISQKRSKLLKYRFPLKKLRFTVRRVCSPVKRTVPRETLLITEVDTAYVARKSVIKQTIQIIRI